MIKMDIQFLIQIVKLFSQINRQKCFLKDSLLEFLILYFLVFNKILGIVHPNVLK